jgi:hypothetical protein
MATSPHPKNFVKESNGATFVSMTYFNPASKPLAKIQPIKAEMIPSSRNGS